MRFLIQTEQKSIGYKNTRFDEINNKNTINSRVRADMYVYGVYVTLDSERSEIRIGFT